VRGAAYHGVQKAGDEAACVVQKLGNANFISRAPEDVVQELRDKREEHQATRAKVAEALKRLGKVPGEGHSCAALRVAPRAAFLKMVLWCRL
jgi:hypothetical protein